MKDEQRFKADKSFAELAADNDKPPRKRSAASSTGKAA